ncbi:hypothetical protein ACA910_015508 [Epithemia clementina (nom. ined.)]
MCKPSSKKPSNNSAVKSTGAPMLRNSSNCSGSATEELNRVLVLSSGDKRKFSAVSQLWMMDSSQRTSCSASSSSPPQTPATTCTTNPQSLFDLCELYESVSNAASSEYHEPFPSLSWHIIENDDYDDDEEEESAASKTTTRMMRPIPIEESSRISNNWRKRARTSEFGAGMVRSKSFVVGLSSLA